MNPGFHCTGQMADSVYGVVLVILTVHVMYSCDGKSEFSASLLQSSVSHDPSEIILFADLNIYDYYNGAKIH